jgi:hypothetical protein
MWTRSWIRDVKWAMVAVAASTMGAIGIGAEQSRGDAPEGFQSTSLMVGGRQVSCSSLGRPVIWVASHYLGDVGMTIPIGQWTVIRYNPIALNTMGDELKLFWLGHECGHAFLRTSDETRADCWSATTGVRQGWFDAADAEDLGEQLQTNRGDATHPPGPARAANVSRCVAAASSR